MFKLLIKISMFYYFEIVKLNNIYLLKSKHVYQNVIFILELIDGRFFFSQINIPVTVNFRNQQILNIL